MTPTEQSRASQSPTFILNNKCPYLMALVAAYYVLASPNSSNVLARHIRVHNEICSVSFFLGWLCRGRAREENRKLARHINDCRVIVAGRKVLGSAWCHGAVLQVIVTGTIGDVIAVAAVVGIIITNPVRVVLQADICRRRECAKVFHYRVTCSLLLQFEGRYCSLFAQLQVAFRCCYVCEGDPLEIRERIAQKEEHQSARAETHSEGGYTVWCAHALECPKENAAERGTQSCKDASLPFQVPEETTNSHATEHTTSTKAR